MVRRGSGFLNKGRAIDSCYIRSPEGAEWLNHPAGSPPPGDALPCHILASINASNELAKKENSWLQIQTNLYNCVIYNYNLYKCIPLSKWIGRACLELGTVVIIAYLSHYMHDILCVLTSKLMGGRLVHRLVVGAGSI